MNIEQVGHAVADQPVREHLTEDAADELVFGFWVFMMSDAVIFSLLFAIFATMITATAGGPSGHDLFDIRSAFEETMVLLLSSFTFGMASLAMHAEDEGRVRRMVFWLAVTLVLGLTFVGLELHEFMSMIAEGAGPDRSGFLSSFFALVSTHGLHVTAGSIWIVVMIVQLLVFGPDRQVRTRIERLGLFWHFLDIVWVCIFSFVYLRGIV